MHVGRAFAVMCAAVPTAVAFVSMTLPTEGLEVGELSSPEAVSEETFINWETPHDWRRHPPHKRPLVALLYSAEAF